MFKFDFSKIEGNPKGSFKFDFTKTQKNAAPLQIGEGAAYLKNPNDRMRAGTNFTVAGGTKEPAATVPPMKGLVTSTPIDAEKGRTKVAAVEDAKNRETLKSNFDAAAKELTNAQSFAATWKNRGLVTPADVTQRVNAATEAYKAVKADYDAAEAQHAEYIRSTAANKTVDTITQLEAVKDYEPTSVSDALFKGPGFKAMAARGKEKNARIFAPVTNTKDFSEAANTHLDFGSKINRLSISYMTEDERNVLAYYLAKEDTTTAEEYFEALSPSLNERRQTEYNAIVSDASEKSPALGVGYNIYGGYASGAALVGTGIQAAKNAVSGQEAPLDTNSLWFVGPNVSNASREGIKRNVNTPLGEFLVDTGLSMAQFASTLPFGSTVGLAILSSGAGGQAAHSAAERGGTARQAFAVGLTAAAAEYVTEKMSFDSLLKIYKAGGAGFKGAFRQTLANIGKQAGTEGLEELTAEYLNNISDALIMGKQSEMNRYIAQLQVQGLSEEEAFRKAFTQFFILNPIVSAAGGVLSGGVMGVSGSFASNLRTGAADAQVGAQLRESWGKGTNEAAAELVATGREYAEGTNSRHYADQAAAKLENGGTLSDAEFGQLYRANNETQRQEAEAYFSGGKIQTPGRVNAQGQIILPTGKEISDYHLAVAQNKHAEQLTAALRDYGVKNVVIENMPEGVSGRWEKGVVYVSSRLDTAQAVNAKVAHEISHAAQQGDADFTNDLLAAMRTLGRDVDAEIARKKKTYATHFQESGKSAAWIDETVTESYAADEVTADFIGELLRDDGLIARLRTRPTLVQRIMDAVNHLLRRGGSTQERAAYTALAEKLRAVAGAAPGTRQAVSGDSVRYAIETQSIKEQIIASQDTLNKMNPVADITSDGFKGLTKQQQLTKVMDMLQSTGYMVDRQNFGTIIFDKKRLHDSLNYAYTDAEKAAFSAIPQVLKRGIEISSRESHKGREYGTLTIAAPVVLNGQRGNMAVVVKQTSQNAYKTHRILMPDGTLFVMPDIGDAEPTISGGLTGEPGTHATPISSAPNNSIRMPEENNKGLGENNSGDTRFSVEEGAPVPWEESETQAQGAGYPVIDGKQVFPYKTWVRDRERGNYGLVVGLGSISGAGQRSLTVSFWNKEKGTRGKADKLPTELEIVTGQYQPSDAELTALFQTEPAESLRGAVSAEDWKEYSGMLEGEQRSKEKGKVVFDELPAKAQKYLQKAENDFRRRLAGLMGIPSVVNNEFFKPYIRDLSMEYVEKGTLSESALDALFNRAWEEGVVVSEDFYNENRALKDELREVSMMISEADKKNIPDYNDWIKKQFGTIRVVKAGGVPVDIRYQELAAENMSLFPESITHPADQLRRIAEVAKGIQKISETLDRYYGNDAEFYKDAAYNDFGPEVNRYLTELRTVRKYSAQSQREVMEREKMLAQGAMQLTAEDIELVKEFWMQGKAAKKQVERATAKNLLTARDDMIVDRLLKGELSIEEIPEDTNARGIRAVYEAKAQYEQAMGVIRTFNRNRKAALRAEADSFLTDAMSWKDKKAGWKYQRETMERNVYDIGKDKATADEIIKRYFEPVHKHEAERTRLKNEYRRQIRELKLSRKIMEGNKLSEAAAVQLYGEALDNIQILESRRAKKGDTDAVNGHTLAEWKGILDDLLASNPNMDMQKIRGAVESFRQIYNELFERMNAARIRNGYEPVDYRRGYFPHFQNEQADGLFAMFGKALGIDMNVSELPTTINGLTHTFRPGIRWTGAVLQRKGIHTVYDAVEGFDRYIEAASDVITHTDDIQSLRSLAEQIRYRTSDEGIRKQIDAVREDKSIGMEEREAKIKEIYENENSTLSNFVVNLEEYTNLLANKKAFADRNMERFIGRKSYDLVKALESSVAANMVAINPASWLTNFIPLTQGGAQLKSQTLLRGMWDSLKSYKADDGFAATSAFLTNRRGSDPLVRTWQEQASATLSKPMEWIDTFVSDSLVRARYMQNRAQGLSEEAAITEADRWTAGVMADRSKGSLPVIFESKNPVMKALTQFQLEVNNQLSYLFKDIPREQRDKGLAALAAVLLKFFLGAWLYNEVYEFFIGRRPALDPIGVLNKTVGDTTGYRMPNTLEALQDAILGNAPNFKTEKKSLAASGISLAKDVAGQLPSGGFFGGGRLPISNALPNAVNAWTATANILSGEGDTKKQLGTLGKELAKPVFYILPPFGGGQLKKAFQGIKAVAQSGRYSVDAQGRDILQYPVFNDTALKTGANYIQAAIFGPTSLKGGKDWIASRFKSLSADQTAVYQELLAAGTRESKAFEIIKNLSGAEAKNPGTRAEIGRSAVRRELLAASDLSEAEKSIVYYGMLATDEEKRVMEQLADLEGEAGAASATLGEIYRIENESEYRAGQEVESATERKRKALLEAELTDEQKKTIYRGVISDSEAANKRIGVTEEFGLGFDAFLEIQNQFDAIDDDEDLKVSQKAIRFISTLSDQGYSSEEISALGEAFMFRTSLGSTNALKRFNGLTSAGLSNSAASDLIVALDELEPLPNKTQVDELQKMRVIADMGFTDANKLAALSAAGIDDSRVKKAKVASGNGVQFNVFVTFLEKLRQYDADGNGSYKQAEVEAALNSMSGLTGSQKAALWQIQGSSWKAAKNPYNTKVGAQIKAALDAEKESEKKATASKGSFTFDFGKTSGAGASAPAQQSTGTAKGSFQFDFSKNG